MSTMTEITAPYNFVPLSGWIFEPEWADRVSHDKPLANGLSGVLTVRVTAHTPLLVGQKQVKATKEQAGDVHFFRTNGRYAIPGSALKGMLRNVLEIASFGKMWMVDEQKLGIRDITGGGHIKDIYGEAMKKQQAGFLRLKTNPAGEAVAEVVPCDFVHVTHDDLKRYIKYEDDCLFRQRMDVPKKYQHWRKHAGRRGGGVLPEIRFNTQAQPKQTGITLAKPNDNGNHTGVLVFTGQISDRCGGKSKKGKKYRDFVFFNKQSNTLEVSPECLAAFRSIHGEGDTRHKGSWNGFWRARFLAGEEIPVFYHVSTERSQEIGSMGLAYMYKLAYAQSIGDVIAQTNPYHSRAKVNKLGLKILRDLPELLFGTVDTADEPGSGGEPADLMSGGLKSRVSFGPHLAVDDRARPFTTDKTILNGPKPTYFPNYLRQPAAVNNELPDNIPYSTYMEKNAEIRGWKRYPVRDAALARVQPLEGKQKDNPAVQVRLHPLPADTVFEGKVRFHNLDPREFGALVWAITWGNKPELRHSLGMGKPFGFGQIDLTLTGAEVFSNRDLRFSSYETTEQLADLTTQHVGEFEELMREEYRKNARSEASWETSPQLINLQKMARPDAPPAVAGKLKYMRMGMKGRNEFVQAKTKGLVLPAYAQPNGPDDHEIFPRKSIGQLRKESEAEREKLEVARREQERENELEQLSPFERLVRVAEEEYPDKKYLGLLKHLEAGTWDNPEEVKEVALRTQSLLRDAKFWRETSAKKNPQKDKPYQLTLRVKRFL